MSDSPALRPALLAPVIAHRGASGEAPENTLGAIRLAAEQGARCVEIDVSISGDGVPYVHHDGTLDRCTSGTGRLCERDAEELDALTADRWARDAGAEHPGASRWLGEPLPRLTAAIRLCDELGLGLNLEIKPARDLERRTARMICPLIERHWPERLPLVLSSFSTRALAAARVALPEAARALLVGKVPRDWQARLERHGCRNLHCAGKHLDAATAGAVRAAGVGLYCYTVNDAERARHLLEIGAHGVITDYPARMLAALGG